MCEYDTEQTEVFRRSEGKLIDVVTNFKFELYEATMSLLMASLYVGIDGKSMLELREFVSTINQIEISFIEGNFCLKIPSALSKFGRRNIETNFGKNDSSIQEILDEMFKIEMLLEEKIKGIEAKQSGRKETAIITIQVAFKKLKMAFENYSKI